MTIELNKDTIIKDLRNKSHLEVAEVTDPEVRYRIEAGTEKMLEISRCVSDAAAMLTHRCIRMLNNGYTASASNAVSLPTTFTYDFDISERRAAGKSSQLAARMHDFIVHYALSKFYSSVSAGDLSNKHSLLTNEAGLTLDEILFFKLPPRK